MRKTQLRSEQIAFLEGVWWASNYDPGQKTNIPYAMEAINEAKRLYPDFDPIPEPSKSGKSTGF